MDTINRIIISIILFTTAMCQNEKENKLIQAWAKIKGVYSNEKAIFDIYYGNRFGEYVISISCLTSDDKERVQKELPKEFEGFRLYFSSPIWGLGELLPEYQKKLEDFVAKHPNANVYGTPESKVYQQLINDTLQTEKEYWGKLSDIQQKKWISNYIKKRRLIDPHFANCGDKYL